MLVALKAAKAGIRLASDLGSRVTAGPSVLARVSRDELEALFRGYGGL